MGDRAVMQVVSSSKGTFSPAVYVHWMGSDVPLLLQRVIERMGSRRDVDYVAARLVCECAEHLPSQRVLGLGMWNVDHVLTADDSHGDAGCALLDVDDWSIRYVGGYLQNSREQQQEAFFYARLAAIRAAEQPHQPA